MQAGNTAPFALQKRDRRRWKFPPRSTAIAKEIEGEWKGGYRAFGYPRKVTIKLQNRGPEGATAEFVIVGRKENKLPVDRVVQQGEFVTVDSHETGLSFEGRARKGEIQGTIFQGPLEIPADSPPQQQLKIRQCRFPSNALILTFSARRRNDSLYENISDRFSFSVPLLNGCGRRAVDVPR